jgi:hypothetical protein
MNPVCTMVIMILFPLTQPCHMPFNCKIANCRRRLDKEKICERAFGAWSTVALFWGVGAERVWRRWAFNAEHTRSLRSLRKTEGEKREIGKWQQGPCMLHYSLTNFRNSKVIEMSEVSLDDRLSARAFFWMLSDCDPFSRSRASLQSSDV